MLVAIALLALVAALAAVAAAVLAARAAGPRAAEAHPEIVGRLGGLEREVEQLPREFRADLAALAADLQARLGQADERQGAQLAALRTEAVQGRAAADEALGRHVAAFSDAQSRRLGETNTQIRELRERTEAALGVLTKDQGERQEALREQLRGHLDQLREGNEKKLDEMRGVVDEKLSSTLNERLDSSFKQVSERLEAVHKGLGEMQSLATGVGDLKRVLTNVKTRGTWGEVQLGALLEDMLTPDQFERQARVRRDSAEVVDFVIKLPEALLPIDCKYPQEDYERLLTAQEASDAVAVDAAGKALERALRVQARSINEKYVHPPETTNFALMYLPTEGLFAEVTRRAAFVQELQQSCRVTIAGPTTLAAILNSFRMGFATLEIQKKSSEIGVVLGQTKTAFEKYGAALDAVDKKLDEAKKKVADVGVRHREITRRLRGVEAVAEQTALAGPSLLAIAAPDDDDDAEAA